jgi:hypothetical protein
MWFLGVIAGGLLGTAQTHNRLAKPPPSLGRLRSELDRKALENSRLVARIVKNAQSSQRKKRKEERR